MRTNCLREHPLPASIVGRILRYPSTSLVAVRASLSRQLVDSRAFGSRCQATYKTEGFVRLGTGGVDAEIVELPLQPARHDRRSEGIKVGTRDGRAAGAPAAHRLGVVMLGELFRFAFDLDNSATPKSPA